MAAITGLGGVFLQWDGDRKELLSWYKNTLSLDVTAYGINFLHPNQFTLITFDREPDNAAVLNFTVDDLEGFLFQIEAKGVQIAQPLRETEYGKFAQISDPHGNLVELWEPFATAYTRMVQRELEAYRD